MQVTSSSELCQRMLDFCQRLTTAKRKILEDPELYPKPEEGPDQMDQKVMVECEVYLDTDCCAR